MLCHVYVKRWCFYCRIYFVLKFLFFFGFPKVYISALHNIIASSLSHRLWILYVNTIVCPHSFWMLYITQHIFFSLSPTVLRIKWWKCWNLSLLKWKIKIFLHCHSFCFSFFFQLACTLTHHVNCFISHVSSLTHSFHAFDHCRVMFVHVYMVESTSWKKCFRSAICLIDGSNSLANSFDYGLGY